jgi:Ca2+-binding RTX toxin-like protein
VISDWNPEFGFLVSDGNPFSGNTGLFSLNIAPPASAVIGTAGSDRMGGSGRSDMILGARGADIIIGKAGHDRLYGQEGLDILQGNTGNDHLAGGQGNDQLLGGSGTDTLVGGAGNDLLNGGLGKDAFLYLAREFGQDDLAFGSRDVVTATRGDRIVFDAGLWAQLMSGGQELDTLHGSRLGTQINADTNIAYANHHLMIDANSDGVFTAMQDVSIHIIGQISKLTVDAYGDALILR